MPQVNLKNQKGEVIGEVVLADEIFGIEPHQQALYEVVRMQQANQRQGTHATKNRSAVSGGGRKPYRQKGTGRARQGSIRAPQFRGGGIVFGPSPRDYSYKVNKKVAKLALKSALSSKVRDDEFDLIDAIVIEVPKTKNFAQIVEDLEAPKKTLFVLSKNEDNENAYRSSRNIPGVQMMESDEINVYDLLNAGKVYITQDAAKEIEEALS